MNCTVNIFAKIPQIGRSKTRLASSVGYGQAKRIASWLFAKTLKEAKDRRWRGYLYISPDREQDRVQGRCDFSVRPQGRGDLGERLERALAKSSCGKIVFIGTDTADLKPKHIAIALTALNRHDLVLGPSSDGGFWLMGINKASTYSDNPFRNVRWSTDQAMEDVISNFPKRTQIYYLEEHTDIDDGNDWLEWSTAKRGRKFLE